MDLQQDVFDMEKAANKNSSDYDDAVSKKDKAFTMFGIYIVMSCLVSIIATYCMMKFCQRASILIHKTMLKRLMVAKMSFYDNHFIGNILNRFSYDLNNIDEIIPLIFPLLINVSKDLIIE